MCSGRTTHLLYVCQKLNRRNRKIFLFVVVNIYRRKGKKTFLLGGGQLGT